jgi:hypothetical protein
MFETLVSIGVSLGLEGLASAWVLARMAINNEANICRCMAANTIDSFYLSFVRMQLCKTVDPRPYEWRRVPFKDSLR